MRKVALTNSKEVAIVDNWNYKRVMLHSNWHLINGSYVRSGNHPQILLHHFVMGVPEKGFEWDHKNRNPLDNREKNFRLATRSQNQANKIIKNSSKSGFKGVYWLEKDNAYVCLIKIDNKTVYLGSFSNPIEAAKTYDKVLFNYKGEFALLNFPIKRFPRLPS